jgi:iron complex transport system permease protein
MRNPLADPYILGVSGGAAAFGSAAIVFLPFSHFFIPPFAAFVGAMVVSISLLYFLKREDEQRRDRALLLGIAINAFASSFVTVIKTLAPMRDTQTLLFWLIGSIGYVDGTWLILTLAISAPFFWLILSRANTLNILKLGDDEALRLGVDVAKEKRILYVAASCLVGLSVAMCGMIAFVGLMTPHLLRPFVGHHERSLLPASALFAAALVVAVDTLSRLSYGWFSSELPVGAMLALIGAPIFVWILFQRGHNAHTP